MFFSNEIMRAWAMSIPAVSLARFVKVVYFEVSNLEEGLSTLHNKIYCFTSLVILLFRLDESLSRDRPQNTITPNKSALPLDLHVIRFARKFPLNWIWLKRYNKTFVLMTFRFLGKQWILFSYDLKNKIHCFSRKRVIKCFESKLSVSRRASHYKVLNVFAPRGFLTRCFFSEAPVFET